ncbi:3-isopropylmalate dehydratase small subunit [Brochothrix campestris]|uniref:3-isopropylmalate dehydratase small subunit n=1 Tax=Brochothrix campestris FSL F6-1037 TaxID=1265861 RepID=W7CPX9_9LIST|nr:3-isopropylmalate dehydratase small subunit [Brochothrix campestris]EUJ41714.1 isopropylmalate isomerase small subunit [Brochothrix campestris FSL F6-1037]
MRPFKQHRGTVVALMNDNIDTDQIIPKQFLKRIERTGFGRFLFDEWRYLPGHQPNPAFPLNAKDRQGASILISGDNFGCGSSREHAPWALTDYGFDCIIAGSFADIFFSNCTKNRLLPIVLPLEQRQQLAALAGDVVVTINLVNQVIEADGDVYPFEINQKVKEKLVEGLDDITLTLTHEDVIRAYEQRVDERGTTNDDSYARN